MAEDDKKYSKQLMNKTVVTKSGKRFGEVKDLVFDTRTGELIQLVLKNSTDYSTNLELEKDRNNSPLIPFSAVIAVGDFVVVSEEDII
ncbi:PRC-barrel domain-containing protein [Candidatus Woesearchaeota archaeon]|nr:PRC-barrel domain-containing protein [Candidatus Woesearchaeota archaeon]